MIIITYDIYASTTDFIEVANTDLTGVHPDCLSFGLKCNQILYIFFCKLLFIHRFYFFSIELEEKKRLADEKAEQHRIATEKAEQLERERREAEERAAEVERQKMEEEEHMNQQLEEERRRQEEEIRLAREEAEASARQAEELRVQVCFTQVVVMCCYHDVASQWAFSALSSQH